MSKSLLVKMNKLVDSSLTEEMDKFFTSKVRYKVIETDIDSTISVYDPDEDKYNTLTKILRNSYAGMMAQALAGVQPMKQSTGSIFKLKPKK